MKKFWKCLTVLLFFMLSATPVCYGEEGLHALIQSGDPLVGRAEYVGPIQHVDENFRILQGGYVNDQYGWFVLINAQNAAVYADTECYVLKYDIHTMEEIARSKVLKLCHANDIAYIPETNELFVSPCVGPRVFVLDADTLAQKEIKKVPKVHYGIAYDAINKRYVIAFDQAGMLVLDSNAKKILAYSFPIDTTLVTQGIYCDDQYIYHVLWSTNSNVQEPDNVIIVFDWECNEVTRIPIGQKGMEPENISLVDDVFYISFNQAQVPGEEVLYKFRIERQE